MKKLIKLLTLINFSLVVLGSADVFADPKRLPAAESTTKTPRLIGAFTVSALQPGSADNLKKQLINELVSRQSANFNMPPFPRIWLEKAHTNAITSNTSLAFSVPGLKGVPVLGTGAKVSKEFKYGLKTSFIMISSRSTSAEGDLNNFEVDKVTDDSHAGEMIRHDELTHINYPNAHGNIPMVGLCVYEASLSIEIGRSAELNFLVFNQSGTWSTADTTLRSSYSSFFRLDPNTSIQEYAQVICGKVFREKVEQSVNNDFSKIVLEKLIAENPLSQCNPTEDRISDRIQGDPSCLSWHKSEVDVFTQKLTVPRCELQMDGAFKCVVKAKETTACNLFIDKKTQTYSAQYDHKTTNIRVTDNSFAYECDANQNLTCKLTKEPRLFVNQPVFQGRFPLIEGHAQCVKKP